jgi:hypothetical protein
VPGEKRLHQDQYHGGQPLQELSGQGEAPLHWAVFSLVLCSPAWMAWMA